MYSANPKVAWLGVARCQPRELGTAQTFVFLSFTPTLAEEQSHYLQRYRMAHTTPGARNFHVIYTSLYQKSMPLCTRDGQLFLRRRRRSCVQSVFRSRHCVKRLTLDDVFHPKRRLVRPDQPYQQPGSAFLHPFGHPVVLRIHLRRKGVST